VQTVFNSNGVPIQTAFNGYLLGTRTIVTATGTSTYTPPVGCKFIYIEICGGGGGGGNVANATAAQITVGAGASGGGFSTIFLPAQVLTLVVGAGGSTSGGSGATSSVTLSTPNGAIAVCTVNGGTGAGGLATGTSVAFVAPPNPAVAGTGGQVRVAGNAATAGHRESGTVACSGRGGHGPWGGGGASIIANGAGNAGLNYGAGGGGGLSINAGGAQNGGAGGQGVAIISEFY
jgi:hypothetical protein